MFHYMQHTTNTSVFSLQSDPNLSPTAMLTLWAIILLLGMSCAMMEENLAVCGREEMDQALSNISSHPGEGVQMRSTLKKVMLQLDLLGDNPVFERVERTVLLKLSGEDLFELQKYVKAEGGSTAVTDVESLLVRSLDVENLTVEKPSASREQSGSNMPKFHLDVDHFNESSVIIFQV